MKFKTRFFFIPLLLLITSTLSTSAQEDPLDKVSWEFSIEQNGCEAVIIGTAKIVDHWHVYAANLPDGSFTLPTELVVEESPNYKKSGRVIEPKPEIIHDKILDEDLYLHSGTVQFKQKIKITANKDFTLKGRYSFQTCDETHCLPPYDGSFELKIKGCEIVETSVLPTSEIESTFKSINGDEAKGKDGSDYVLVNEQWYKVPEGNSLAFYKIYIELGGSHD